MNYVVPDPMLFFSFHANPAQYIDTIEQLADSCETTNTKLLFLSSIWDMLWDILKTEQSHSKRMVHLLNKISSNSEVVPFKKETEQLSNMLYQQYDAYILKYQRQALALSSERWLDYVSANLNHLEKLWKSRQVFLLDNWLKSV